MYPTVAVESRVGGAPYEGLSRQQAAEHLREAEALLGEGANALYELIPGHSPAAALAGPAEDDDGLLVVGSNHRGRLGRVLLGGTGSRLMRRSNVPVAVAPRGFAEREVHRPGVVGVALGAGEDANAGTAVAVALAERLHARLHVLHVLATEQMGRAPAWASPDPEDLVELRERAFSRLDAAMSVASARVPVDGRVLEGAPGPALIDAAGALDLLVLGPRGNWLQHLLGGSVARRLVHAPPCPLLVLPHGAALAPLLAVAGARDHVVPRTAAAPRHG